MTSDSPVDLVQPDRSELPVIVVSQDQPDPLDPAERSDSLASRVRSVIPAALEVSASRVPRDSVEFRVLPERRETPARQGGLDAKGPRASRALRASRAPRVALACRVR